MVARRAYRLCRSRRAALFAMLCLGTVPCGAEPDPPPIVDSAMTLEEALEGLDPRCPEEIRRRQRLVDLTYLGFDGNVHEGQLVVDEELVNDVVDVFRIAREHAFPITSVIPIAHKDFREEGRWNDDLSMEANNTSAFNYRETTGGGKLSMHALGRAIDVNPRLNPYIKGDLTLPKGATYVPEAPGALFKEHPVVQAFLDRGWTWGGEWTSLKDYQHFEKAVSP
jgi:peptidoglycan L-alanyl-D-glutamate endopeptidase CwlK